MKKKVNLDKLRVTSFVTNLEDETNDHIKGGSRGCTHVFICGTQRTGPVQCPIEEKPFGPGTVPVHTAP